MPLVIYGLRGGHTHTHTHAHTHTHTHTHTYFGGMKVISRNQVRAGLWLVGAWFKNQACTGQGTCGGCRLGLKT